MSDSSTPQLVIQMVEIFRKSERDRSQSIFSIETVQKVSKPGASLFIIILKKKCMLVNRTWGSIPFEEPLFAEFKFKKTNVERPVDQKSRVPCALRCCQPPKTCSWNSVFGEVVRAPRKTFTEPSRKLSL